MTENTPSIQVALAGAKAAIKAVGKTGRNQQQGYNFRGVDAVVNAAAPELNKAGVIVMPILQSIEYDTVETGKNRTPMAHCRVTVIYRFHGPAGDSIEALVPGEAMDSGDKASPKAMSVAYRIALLQVLNLPTDEADPDEKAYERSPRDSFENARPANQRPAANGAARGQVARPAPVAAAPNPDAEPDEDAQNWADEAHIATTVKDLERIHKAAREAGKIGATIRNPATGNIGQLALYLDWRRKQVKDLDDAWREFNDAAGRHRTDLAELEIQLKQKTGVHPEAATAGQIREFIASLGKAAA